MHLYQEAINTSIDTLCVLLEIVIGRKTYSRSQKCYLEIHDFPGGCLVLRLLGSVSLVRLECSGQEVAFCTSELCWLLSLRKKKKKPPPG